MQTTVLKRYMCAQCNTEYQAEDKYDLASHLRYVDFGMDIEDYDESEIDLNVIQECEVCHEPEDEVPYEPKDVG